MVRRALGLGLLAALLGQGLCEDDVSAFVQVQLHAQSDFDEAGEAAAASDDLQTYFATVGSRDPEAIRAARHFFEEAKERLYGFDDEASWRQADEEEVVEEEKAETNDFEKRFSERNVNGGVLKNAQKLFEGLSALSDADRMSLKASEQESLEMLRAESTGVTSGVAKSKIPVGGALIDGVNYRKAAKEALSTLVAQARAKNPSTSMGENYNEVRKYIRQFSEEKSTAQKHIQEALTNNFDWENKDVVLKVMQDWRTATKSIVPKAKWTAENPNCLSNPMDKDERETLNERIATSDGQPNTRAWCFLRTEQTLRTGHAGEFVEEAVLKKCILDEDLPLSAVQTYNIQKAAGNDEMEASYCFLEGHCYNAGLDKYSTQEQGQQVCDMRYGHKAWTSVGFNKVQEQSFVENKDVSATGGIRSKEVSAHWGKVACAMGSFHCDAALCQEKYCHSPYYKQKYESLYGSQ